MFNKFCNFSIDEDMMSEWVKMFKCPEIVDQSSVVLQMTVHFILDKFLQFSLKLRNEYIWINQKPYIWIIQRKYHYATLLAILYLV